MNWNGTGNHALTVSNNTFNSDASIIGTNGLYLTSYASGASSLIISGNQFNNQSSNGIFCNLFSNTNMNLSITDNVVSAIAQPGGNGIQVNAHDTAIATGSITYNTCSEHLSGNINGFPTDSGQLFLTIANNHLTGPSSVPGGSYPTGIQFSGSNSSIMDLDIYDNTINGHADHGINLFVLDSATVTATINENVLTVPDTFTNTGGIQVSASNSSAAVSTYVVTNNTCTGHTNGNIQCFPNLFSEIHLTIAGNTLQGPAITPPGSFPDGIQISTGDSANVIATINGGNHCIGHTARGINLFSSNDSFISAIIDGNTISGGISSNATNGISIGSNNTSSTPVSSYTISNNICSNHNNGNIQCYPSGSTQCSLVISNNVLSTAIDGISGASPNGIQVGASNSSHLTAATISGNTWTGPETYQSSGTPQGISVGGSNSAIIGDIIVSNNTILFPMTSYQENTGPTGIQSYLNDGSTVATVAISGNHVTFSNPTYANNTGPSGIQMSAQGTSVLTEGNISDNIVFFAPIASALTNFQSNGISVGGSDSAFVGTSISSVNVQQNTISNIEGNGITLINSSTNDNYIDASGNTVYLGSVMQNEIGIVTAPFGTGKLIAVIDGNTIYGNDGGFIGIAATNQSPVCQSAIVQNNIVSNVHGNNPAIPVPGLGGGMGSAVLGSGNLSVFFLNNSVSGNTPQGIFGLDSATLGGSGTICIALKDNHGIGAALPDNYTLYNYSSPASSFMYDDQGGNTGTLNFTPSMSDFTAGSCPACP